MYSHEKYAKLVEETVGKIKELSSLKGGEYAGDTDRLANFRRNAERLGLSMEAIWAVYCNKHIDAINQFCADIQAGKTRKRMESISGRADDVIVYMILFKAMVEEREGIKIDSTESTSEYEYQDYCRKFTFLSQDRNARPAPYAEWVQNPIYLPGMFKYKAKESVAMSGFVTTAPLDEDARFELDSYDKYVRACGRREITPRTFLQWKDMGKPVDPST